MARYMFSVPGPPVPKGRPRLGRGGHTYTPRRTRGAELHVWVCAKAAGVRRLEGPVSVRLAFYVPDHRRRDVDNLAKLVLDALNTTAWADDSQVVELVAGSHYDRDNPRTEVEIEEVER